MLYLLSVFSLFHRAFLYNWQTQWQTNGRIQYTGALVPFCVHQGPGILIYISVRDCLPYVKTAGKVVPISINCVIWGHQYSLIDCSCDICRSDKHVLMLKDFLCKTCLSIYLQVILLTFICHMGSTRLNLSLNQGCFLLTDFRSFGVFSETRLLSPWLQANNFCLCEERCRSNMSVGTLWLWLFLWQVTGSNKLSRKSELDSRASVKKKIPLNSNCSKLCTAMRCGIFIPQAVRHLLLLQT